MARPRVEVDRLLELIRLWRLGSSARAVVRVLRLSPKTERKYRAVFAASGLLHGPADHLPSRDRVRAAVLRAFPPPPRALSSVDPWRTQVLALLAKGLAPRAIFDRLRLEPACGRVFRGTYSAVRRFVHRLTREAQTSPGEISVPIVTLPGEEAQVDFGYAGRLYDPSAGVVRRAWVFVIVLCHSRHFFARIVFDQKTETWLELHAQAFRHFGGVPRTVVPDNTKRAVLRAAFGLRGSTELERSYREFARAWGFHIDPAPPGEPRKRGKVEATVKYLRNNPLKSRDGEDVTDVQAALDRWCREVASVRVHGSTGCRPLEAFVEEDQPALLPLIEHEGPRAIWKRAKVHPDAHVSVRGRLFSVPWQLVHAQVWVRTRGDLVEVFHAEQVVAAHQDQGRRRTTRDDHLPQDRGLLRFRSRRFWEQRAEQVGPATTALVRAVFDQDDVLSHLRSVQAIVRLLERVPPVRAESLSRRACRVGDLSYHGLKAALDGALDLAPLPHQCAYAPPSPQPRALQASLR